MKAGIGHLSEKLQVVKLEGETTVDPNETKPPNLIAPMFAQVMHEASHRRRLGISALCFVL